MKFQIVKYSVFFLFISLLMGFKSGNCDSKLQLKKVTDSSFIVDVEASGAFEAKIFYLESGEYLLQETKSSSGNKELEFENILNDRIYKVVVKYSSTNALCGTRQLSGLKL